MLKIILAAAVSAALLTSEGSFAAEAYPTRPVRFIVPGAPGSGTDRVARLVADRLTQAWPQNALVENKPGASGMIGAEYVARAPADGYTALFAFLALVQVPAMYPKEKVPYDLFKDFAPVTMAVSLPSGLAVRSDSPYKTLADYVEAAKKKPGEITYGSFGIGTSFHIYGEALQRDAGMKLNHIAYKSESLSFNDLLGGHIDSSFASVAMSSEMIKAGRVRQLAVVGNKRTPVLPDVPAFVEFGYKRMSPLGWFGVFLPSATPKPLVDKMSADIATALKRQDVIDILRDQMGAEPGGNTPEEFTKFVNEEYIKWRDLITEIGIKPES
jgi:tripartite-type tricarboxylate transporter receptor subunit TctC